MPGLNIALEGVDGSGKSTIVKLVRDLLPELEFTVVRHPGATPWGSRVRDLVLSKDFKPHPLAHQALYVADFIQFQHEILEPTLSRGGNVISDRYTPISLTVYGSACGLPPEDIQRLLTMLAARKLDLLCLLRCPWRLAKSRVASRMELDFFDAQSAKFYGKVQDEYEAIATSSAFGRVESFDATMTLDGLAAAIVASIRSILP